MVKWYWNHIEKVCFLFLCNIAVVDVFVVFSLLLLFFLISWGWPKLDGKKKEWNSFVVSLNIWRLLANVGQMICFEWEYLTASIIIRLHLVLCIIYYLEHSYKKRRSLETATVFLPQTAQYNFKKRPLVEMIF